MPGEGVRSPGTRVAGNREMQEQKEVLTTEPSPAPIFLQQDLSLKGKLTLSAGLTGQ